MNKQKATQEKTHHNKNQIVYQTASVVCIILGILLIVPKDIILMPPELPKAIPGVLLVVFGALSTLKMRWARTVMLVLTAVMLPFALFSGFWVLLALYMDLKGAIPSILLKSSFIALTLATIGFIGSFIIFVRQAIIDANNRQSI